MRGKDIRPALENVIDDYYEWLLDIIDIPGTYDVKDYSILLDYLFKKEFIWSVDRDENREEAGLDLRYEFLYDNKMEEYYEDIEKPCSVLEMMIALSIDWEQNIMYEPEFGDRTNVWFWVLITNLDLVYQKNTSFNIFLVENAVNRCLYREYGNDGVGGFFPLKHPKRDQKYLENWYQLEDFVLENYEV